MIELSIALTVLAIAAWDVGRRYVARDSIEARDLSSAFNEYVKRLDGRMDVVFEEMVSRVTSVESAMRQLGDSASPAQLVERIERMEAALTNLAKQAQSDLSELKSDMETLRGEAVSAARLAARVGRRK